MTKTVTVIDHARAGRKGYPMHPEAYPNFTPPTKQIPVSEANPSDLVDPVEKLLAHSAGVRWQRETSGFEFNGVHVATDDRSKLMISGARVAAMTDPTFQTVWKDNNGNHVQLTAAAIIQISNAVLSHIADCFSVEATVAAAIMDGTITTTLEVEAAYSSGAVRWK